jgi:uncharacterized membrane protein YcaP (DUF421 family)
MGETVRRILLGNAPFGYLAELLVRVLVVYSLLLVIVRFLGKRMSGQITNVELGVMIVLGGIVAVPLEIADRGMLPGLLLLVTVLGLQRALGALQTRSPAAERTMLGHASTLVRDGMIQLAELEQAAISQQQLFSLLRGSKVRQLGEVQRAYLEAYGFLSVWRKREPAPGLAVLPNEDDEYTARLVPSKDHAACNYCGFVTSSPAQRCAQCGREHFGPAVTAAAQTS